MASPISARSRARARFCRRCGSALPNDGPCAACVAREQAHDAFIIPRPSQLGHGLAEVALDPMVDSQPLIPEGHRPKGDSSPISGYRAKWAAMRNKNGVAAATRERSPHRAPGARYGAIPWGPPSAWREAAREAPVEAVIAIAAGILSGVVVPILLR